MGTDELAVVDHPLRVRGLDGLRIIDASVMPRIPRGHTNLPTIAEKAAELIRRTPASQPQTAGIELSVAASAACEQAPA